MWARWKESMAGGVGGGRTLGRPRPPESRGAAMMSWVPLASGRSCRRMSTGCCTARSTRSTSASCIPLPAPRFNTPRPVIFHVKARASSVCTSYPCGGCLEALYRSEVPAAGGLCGLAGAHIPVSTDPTQSKCLSRVFHDDMCGPLRPRHAGLSRVATSRHAGCRRTGLHIFQQVCRLRCRHQRPVTSAA